MDCKTHTLWSYFRLPVRHSLHNCMEQFLQPLQPAFPRVRTHLHVPLSEHQPRLCHRRHVAFTDLARNSQPADILVGNRVPTQENFQTLDTGQGRWDGGKAGYHRVNHHCYLWKCSSTQQVLDSTEWMLPIVELRISLLWAIHWYTGLTWELTNKATVWQSTCIFRMVNMITWRQTG